MGRKGNLAVFDSSNIFETREVTPTKIGVHVCYINAYVHDFLMTMDYSPWVERKIWPFLKVTISPKPEESHPPKLVYINLISIPISMNFWSQFRSIKFFDDHGL